jgi:hypothetical protein
MVILTRCDQDEEEDEDLRKVEMEEFVEQHKIDGVIGYIEVSSLDGTHVREAVDTLLQAIMGLASTPENLSLLQILADMNDNTVSH